MGLNSGQDNCILGRVQQLGSPDGSTKGPKEEQSTKKETDNFSIDQDTVTH